MRSDLLFYLVISLVAVALTMLASWLMGEL